MLSCSHWTPTGKEFLSCSQCTPSGRTLLRQSSGARIPNKWNSRDWTQATGRRRRECSILDNMAPAKDWCKIPAVQNTTSMYSNQKMAQKLFIYYIKFYTLVILVVSIPRHSFGITFKMSIKKRYVYNKGTTSNNWQHSTRNFLLSQICSSVGPILDSLSTLFIFKPCFSKTYYNTVFGSMNGFTWQWLWRIQSSLMWLFYCKDKAPCYKFMPHYMQSHPRKVQS